MLYYEKYSPTVLFLSMILLSVALCWLFRKKITSIIDPLLFHIVWCSSGLALLFGYFYSYGINIDGFLFTAVYAVYLFTLYIFLNGTIKDDAETLYRELQHPKNTKLYVLCLILNIISRYEFIEYALSNPSIIEWFLYRFKQIEGRNPLQYILQLGSRPFFLYYTFVLIRMNTKWQPYVIAILIVNSLMDIVAGGRSSIISLILAYGYFVYHFSPIISSKKRYTLNVYGIVAISVALFVGSLVTSFYQKEGTLADGVMSMGNRLLAAGDGLEMYLANNGSYFIKTGFDEYAKSVFGIFIKRVSNVQTQSVGWQLYELENGFSVSFSVGPNFILPLQVFVIGKYYLIFYCVFISYLVSFLRGDRLKKMLVQSRPLSFVLGLLSFDPTSDIESFVLAICACLFIYVCFIFPFMKLRIKNDLFVR